MVLVMSPMSSRPFLRLAAAAALVAALGLAGCGRKGLLDPPPAAQSQTEQQPAAPRSGLASPVAVSPFGGAGSSPNSDMTIGPDGQPVVRGPKRALPMDVLLN